MKKSLLKRIIAVSLLSLNISQGMSCYAHSNNETTNNRETEEVMPHAPISLAVEANELINGLLRLIHSIIPFMYGSAVVRGGDEVASMFKERLIDVYGSEDDALRNIPVNFETVDTTEWAASFKASLGQEFFESLRFVGERAQQLYLHFGENENVRITFQGIRDAIDSLSHMNGLVIGQNFNVTTAVEVENVREFGRGIILAMFSLFLVIGGTPN